MALGGLRMPPPRPTAGTPPAPQGEKEQPFQPISPTSLEDQELLDLVFGRLGDLGLELAEGAGDGQLLPDHRLCGVDRVATGTTHSLEVIAPNVELRRGNCVGVVL